MISNPIAKIFGRSPISPLQKHMVKVHESATKLLAFFNAVLAEDWQQAESLQIQISDLEKQADNLKIDIRLHLPKSLFLPVSRTDLLELLVAQDQIANKAKDIAGLVLGRRMHIPQDIAEQFITLLQRSIAATDQAAKAINELDELFEAGFRGREVEIVKKMLHKLNAIENETDILQREVRHKLFTLENTLPPIDVIFLYKAIEWIGDLADKAHHVGGRLHLLLAY